MKFSIATTLCSALLALCSSAKEEKLFFLSSPDKLLRNEKVQLLTTYRRKLFELVPQPTVATLGSSNPTNSYQSISTNLLTILKTKLETHPKFPKEFRRMFKYACILNSNRLIEDESSEEYQAEVVDKDMVVLEPRNMITERIQVLNSLTTRFFEGLSKEYLENVDRDYAFEDYRLPPSGKTLEVMKSYRYFHRLINKIFNKGRSEYRQSVDPLALPTILSKLSDLYYSGTDINKIQGKKDDSFERLMVILVQFPYGTSRAAAVSANKNDTSARRELAENFDMFHNTFAGAYNELYNKFAASSPLDRFKAATYLDLIAARVTVVARGLKMDSYERYFCDEATANTVLLSYLVRVFIYISLDGLEDSKWNSIIAGCTPNTDSLHMPLVKHFFRELFRDSVHDAFDDLQLTAWVPTDEDAVQLLEIERTDLKAVDTDETGGLLVRGAKHVTNKLVEGTRNIASAGDSDPKLKNFKRYEVDNEIVAVKNFLKTKEDDLSAEDDYNEANRQSVLGYKKKIYSTRNLKHMLSQLLQYYRKTDTEIGPGYSPEATRYFLMMSCFQTIFGIDEKVMKKPVLSGRELKNLFYPAIKDENRNKPAFRQNLTKFNALSLMEWLDKFNDPKAPKDPAILLKEIFTKKLKNEPIAPIKLLDEEEPETTRVMCVRYACYVLLGLTVVLTLMKMRVDTVKEEGPVVEGHQPRTRRRIRA